VVGFCADSQTGLRDIRRHSRQLTTINIRTQKDPVEQGLSADLISADLIELFCDRGEFGGVDVDEATVLALVLKADDAIHLGKESVVFATADGGTRFERGAALTYDDASTKDRLSAEDLNAEPLGI
jgi:hypothetical protein